MIFNQKIAPLITDTSLLHLMVEVGVAEVNFLFYSTAPFQLHGFYQPKIMDTIAEPKNMELIKELVSRDTFLSKPFASVKIAYNFKTCALLPIQFFKVEDKAAILNVMHGVDFSSYSFHEDVQGGNIKLVYRVPCNVYDTFSNLFAKSIFMHSTSIQINNFKNQQNFITCIVYNGYVKLILFKEKMLQIVQYFDYSTPIEVSYHILNVCSQFNVEVANVALQVSGNIEPKSSLYEELYKYFLNISILPIPIAIQLAPTMQNLPTYYYNALTNLALCE